MFHYSSRVIDEPKMSEIRILNLCHKKTILVDIYRQSLLRKPLGRHAALIFCLPGGGRRHFLLHLLNDLVENDLPKPLFSGQSKKIDLGRLGDCPPTLPLSQPFALLVRSNCKCWLKEWGRWQ